MKKYFILAGCITALIAIAAANAGNGEVFVWCLGVSVGLFFISSKFYTQKSRDVAVGPEKRKEKFRW